MLVLCCTYYERYWTEPPLFDIGREEFPSDLILKFPNLLPRCVKRYVMTGGWRPLFGSGPICSPARVVRTVRAGISALCRPHQTQCWAGPGPCQLRTAAAGGVIRLQLLHGQDCCCRLLLRSWYQDWLMSQVYFVRRILGNSWLYFLSCKKVQFLFDYLVTKHLLISEKSCC